jgi:two-component system sensor histidine kinase ChvG
MIDGLKAAGRSLIGRILVLAAIFLVVPVILFSKFAEADRARQDFLLRSLQAQGKLVAQQLQPLLNQAQGRNFLNIAKTVESLANDQMRVKLLLRPAGQKDSFFLVAANPPLQFEALEGERQSVDQTGVLLRLDESCDGDRALSVRYKNASGNEELLTSMSPLHSAAGCWVVLTSFASEDLASASLARPFMQAPEVRLALGFYVMMALLIAFTLAGTLFDLKNFAKVARSIRQGGTFGKPSFAAHSAIPELRPVAQEFDRMVATLEASAQALREAAEDNAHAFKAPIAAITQAIEPLRQEAGAERAVATIGHAVDRLSSLLQAARRLDVAAAEVMTARLDPVDLTRLARQMAEAYDRVASPCGVRVIGRVAPDSMIWATEDSIETVIENLLDNALSFAPPDSAILLTLENSGRHAVLRVEDEGPGVPTDQLDSIFRRNFSYRPARGGDHSGIGLAVVRRTVELLGGEVGAENLSGRGFRVTLRFPLM